MTIFNMVGGGSGGSVDPVYNGEYIEYKMDADASGNLYAPTAGFSTTATQDCPYSWKISVDGGAETTYTGTGSTGGKITLSGYTANISHIIKIVPTTESYGWARAYCWYATNIRSYLTEIIYDSSYMGYAVSATDTGRLFRGFQYYGCINLTNAAQEYMPNTVTTIGRQYLYLTYGGCTSLIKPSNEAFSGSVTSVDNAFRSYQYNDCTSLAYPGEEAFSDTVTTIGSEFRDSQYRGSGIGYAPEEKFSKNVTSIPANFRRTQFYQCTNLVLASKNEALSGLDKTITIGEQFRQYQYRDCTKLTEPSNEYLPNTVTSIGGYFRNAQYSDCTSLKYAAEEAINNVSSIGTQFRGAQYYGCTALTDIRGWMDVISGSASYRYTQFYNCTASKTVKVKTGSNYNVSSYNQDTLQDNYVTQIQVPSSDLTTYKNSGSYPRVGITDSKFVGY